MITARKRFVASKLFFHRTAPRVSVRNMNRSKPYDFSPSAFFETEFYGQKSPYVKVTSKKKIVEVLLNLLLLSECNWTVSNSGPPLLSPQVRSGSPSRAHGHRQTLPYVQSTCRRHAPGPSKLVIMDIWNGPAAY